MRVFFKLYISITLKATLMKATSMISTPHETSALRAESFHYSLFYLFPSGPFTSLLCGRPHGVVLFGHCMSDLYILCPLWVSLICFSKESKNSFLFSLELMPFQLRWCWMSHQSQRFDVVIHGGNVKCIYTVWKNEGAEENFYFTHHLFNLIKASLRL